MRLQLPAAVNMIIDVLQAHGYEGFAVGGCVRDSVLNRTPDDWDITTSATPYQVKELFSKTVDTGLQHGTVTVMVHGVGYEVTTYRIDGEYEDGRHPKEVQFTSNLTEDLKRRDFTINAMAYSKDRGLIDEFGGMQDLQRKIIRCVGILAVYILSGLAGGIYMGKTAERKRYLWGMILGSIYWGILMLLTIFSGAGTGSGVKGAFLTLLICAGSSTLGAMVTGA